MKRRSFFAAVAALFAAKAVADSLPVIPSAPSSQPHAVGPPAQPVSNINNGLLSPVGATMGTRRLIIRSGA